VNEISPPSPEPGPPEDQKPPSSPFGRLRIRVSKGALFAEDSLSMIAFSLMTLLPVYSMTTRLLRLPDIPINAVIVQQLTLWIAMLGGCLAARSQRLLGISSMELLPDKWRPPVRVFTNAVLAAVCVCLAYSSLEYLKSIHGEELFPGLQKTTVLQIMPIGFAVIALRAVWHAGSSWIPRLIAAVGLFVPLILGYQVTPETPHILAIAMAIFLAATVLGLPIFAVFSGLSLLLYWNMSSVDQPGQVQSVPLEMVRIVASPLLPSIPLFTLAGYFMVQGGATKRLLRVFTAMFSWIPGGLAIATVCICTIFTFAGSGLTILSLGGLLVPMLIRTGYPEKFSIGLLTSSGSLGLLFPTSVPAILYCVYSLDKSHSSLSPITPARLFTGAILPELVMISCVAAVGIYMGIKHGAVRQAFSWREAASSIWVAKWELLLPAIMITGVFGGFGTLTEAAALTAFAAFIVEVFIYRDLKLKADFRQVFVECATIVGGILLIMGVALGFTAFLIDAHIPAHLVEWVRAHVQSKYVFLLLLNGVLLVVGALMDIFAAILVVVPLIAPLAQQYGVDPVQMGVIFIANLELGYLHPPVGINLFLAAYRFKKPMGTVIWATLPFLMILMGTVLLITYVPWLTTAPLRWFGLSP
jgi:C4-dicarboxylate transporter DctM subunit